MSVSSLNLSTNYIGNTLIPNLNLVTLATELGGKTSAISSFSFAGAASTYSFGLYQYDVGANPAAREFLSSIGFSATQISQLSQNGGLTTAQVTALSNQLSTALEDPANAAALQTLNSTWASGLVTQVQNVLNTVSQTNPGIADQIYSSPAMQLQLLDYANQFGLSTTGPMANWLSGQSITEPGGTFKIPAASQLTGNEIQSVVMGTAYGVSNSTSETNRENALNSTLNSITLGVPGVTINATSFNGTFTGTDVTLSSGTAAVISGSGDAFTMGSGSSVSSVGTANAFSCGPNSIISVNGTESVTCAPSGSLTVTGSNVAASVAANSTVTVNGTGNNFTLDNGSAINFTSTGNNAVICGGIQGEVTGNANLTCTGGVLGVSGNDGTVTVNNETITVAAGSTVTVSGSGDTINAGAGANITIEGNGSAGTADTVNESNGSVTLEANARAAVNGSGDTVTASSADNLGVYGGNDTVTGVSGDGIWVGQNGATSAASDTVNASGATVTVAANSRVNVFGANDTVNGQSSDNFGVYGASDTVNGVAGDGIWVGQNGATTTASDTVNASGATVTIAANSRVNINGSSDTVDGQSSDNFGVYGASDTVNGVSGDGIWIGQNGSTSTAIDTVNASNAGVTIAANSHANVYGSSDTVNGQSADNFGVYGNGDSINGVSGDNIWVGTNGTVGAFDGVAVSGATLTVTANSQVNVTGNTDTVNMSTGDSVGVYGGGNTINSGAGNLVVLGNTGGNYDTVDATGDASGSTTANGQATGIALNTSTQANINGSHDSLSGSTGDTLHVSGTYDPFSGNSDSVTYSGANTGDTVTGSGDTGTGWIDPPVGDGGGGDGDGDGGGDPDAVSLAGRNGAIHTNSVGKSVIRADTLNAEKLSQPSWIAEREGVFFYDDESDVLQRSDVSSRVGIAATSQNAHQLIQSMASFGVPSAAQIELFAANKTLIHPPLLAASH